MTTHRLTSLLLLLLSAVGLSAHATEPGQYRMAKYSLHAPVGTYRMSRKVGDNRLTEVLTPVRPKQATDIVVATKEELATKEFASPAKLELAPTIEPAAPKRSLIRKIADSTRALLSKLAKGRDRNEKGEFLPVIAKEDIEKRAYDKWEQRSRTGAPGDADSDFLTAKRELQDEKLAANKAAKATLARKPMKAKFASKK